MKEDQEGLNLDARDLLCGTLFSLLRLGRLKKIWQNELFFFSVFSKPNGFFFLNELNLSNVGLKDQDMMHIQRLPRLSRLWMSNTGIGNEA